MATIPEPRTNGRDARLTRREWQSMLYFLLHGLGFLISTLLLTWGLFCLFFLAIVTPVILLAFVIYGLFSRWVFHSIGHPWAGALANAAAFAWLIAVTFPVVSP